MGRKSSMKAVLREVNYTYAILTYEDGKINAIVKQGIEDIIDAIKLKEEMWER
jgi:hypothetical protein